MSPVPMSKKTVGVAPTPGQNGVDLSFLAPGKTTRAEVQRTLSATLAVDEDRLILERWATSRSGWVWIAGGGYAAAGGGWRNWKMHNLIVQFDENGMVSNFADVSENDVARELAARLRPNQPDCLATECEIDIDYHRRRDKGGEFQTAQLVFSKHSFALRTHGSRNHDFEVPPAEIARLSRAGILKRDSGDPDPLHIEESLSFKHKTRAGGLITFKIAPSDLVVLIDYLKQNQPAAIGKGH